MKKLLIFILLYCSTSAIYAQDNVAYRVIFIGDAGEINQKQSDIIQNAVSKIIPTKTSVVFLGDNIYPRGFGLPGSKEETTSIAILQAQYKPMRAKDAPVYFIPGNHDWDKSGPKGLEKIKLQWKFIEDQNDDLLKLLPPNGCPDPITIPLSEKLVMIVFDSEWWLYPYEKTNNDAECTCKSKDDVLARLEELQAENKDKVILLTSHHPFQSYGTHGGKFTIKDHIFPLTNVSENLYIPLPLVGSLYPILRTTFPNPEDLKHPLYRDMIRKIDAVFEEHANLIHIAGHEHGLQFIKGNQTQIVSGSGAKTTKTHKEENSLFATGTEGFVVADFLTDNTTKFTYYVRKNNTINEAFSYTIPYNTPIKPERNNYNPIQADSIVTAIHPSYNDRGKFHRLLFGENYRKEWATPVKLPVIKLSTFNGGLTPIQLGGGMQSKSLRLKDNNGKEWVIRSVEKNPDALLPVSLKETFAKDWVDDATSAQHPFSALVVPPLAKAINAPHSNPIIGVLSADENLGIYNRKFANLVVLLEEREPLGKSDNSVKMKENLQKDNDNGIQGKEFLRSRILDAYLGDWDRHEDQWRWRNTAKGKEKNYIAVPRDRDQVFHLTQGLFPKMASSSYILPTLRNFNYKIYRPKWLLYKTRFLNSSPDFQLSREEWQTQAQEIKTALTDAVLEEALQQLPKEVYAFSHDALLAKLKSRRDELPKAIDDYYKFTQKIVDIKTSDKNEFVKITDAENGNLTIQINKLNKNNIVENELMNKTYDANLTKEIRIYLSNGNDSLLVDTKSSRIKLRIIGGSDSKKYNIVNSNKKIKLYDVENGSTFFGKESELKKHISNNKETVAFKETNLYNIWSPLIVAGLNLDDGFIFGGGFRLIKQEGFRKIPYASSHQFTAGYSFSSGAYRIKYNAEWIGVLGKADIIFHGLAKAPENATNFFGRGNETEYNKDVKIRYYRTRFSTFQFDPALRWKGKKGASLQVGPSLYYYTFDADDNQGRFINNTQLIGSYDSAFVDKSKLHLGAVVQYSNDKRNNKIVPQWGSFVNIRLQSYKGIGEYTKDFTQIIPEVALYKSLNPKATVVLAERFGGTVSFGNPAFYQSATIGGQENLLGYRQYRFSGKHSFYNNVELRLKIADLASYIAPGQLGILGFWDTGRVWENESISGKWHNGFGGGIYFAPASMVSLNLILGSSSEGIYPYFTMGMRF